MALNKPNNYLVYLFFVTLVACSQTRLPSENTEPLLPPVGIVALNQVDVALSEHLLVDIAVNVFGVEIDEQ